MIYILGGEGFVGSALARLFEARKLEHCALTRANYNDYAGTRCDVFINADGNSKKFMADRDPLWEFDASVRSVAKSLVDFDSALYVQLSTGDVYPRQDNPEITREDRPLNPAEMSRYGVHKYAAEILVRGAAKDWLVFRMGGFVGPGLKKNAIFDMLNDAPVWLTPDSELQFISTDGAAEIIWTLADKGVAGEIVNLGAKGVARIGDLYDRISSKSDYAPEARRVRFEISTDKLEGLYGARLPSTEEEIDSYLVSLGR